MSHENHEHEHEHDHEHDHNHENHAHAHSHAHGHSHGHSHSHHHDPGKNIATAFFLNFIFAIVELVGGLITNSVAILSDALHDFGDSVSLGAAWALQKRSKKGRDSRFTYGYKRFSLLGGVFLSGVLLVSSIFIVTESVRRLIEPQDVRADGMLWLALVGIAVNGFAALRLSRGSTLGERAVWLHLMEDVLGWVAVLVMSLVMLFVAHPATRYLDPLLSLGITIWVLRGVWRNLRDTFRILLQGTPEGVDPDRLTDRIAALDGVCGVHDLHVWSQDGESNVTTMHVVTTPEADLSSLKHRIRDLAGGHVTIEFESSGDSDCEYANCR